MSYALLSATTPKARKEHRCIWCGQKILIGETYRHERSVYDGDMQNHKWHLECDKASAEYFAENGEEFDPYDNERPPKLQSSERQVPDSPRIDSMTLDTRGCDSM